MTFQAYTRPATGRQLHLIREGLPVDSVVFESGYDSHSGFRDAFARTFGSTPRNGRGQDCIYLSWLKSPLGPLVAGATAEGVCLVEFTDRRMLETELAALRKYFGAPAVPGTNGHLRRLTTELRAYFAGNITRVLCSASFRPAHTFKSAYGMSYCVFPTDRLGRTKSWRSQSGSPEASEPSAGPTA